MFDIKNYLRCLLFCSCVGAKDKLPCNGEYRIRRKKESRGGRVYAAVNTGIAFKTVRYLRPSIVCDYSV